MYMLRLEGLVDSLKICLNLYNIQMDDNLFKAGHLGFVVLLCIVKKSCVQTILNDVLRDKAY